MKIPRDNVERKQEEVGKRVLGSTNIKGKGKAREGSVPRPWDTMILGKKQ